jgi:hypothetical protein
MINKDIGRFYVSMNVLVIMHVLQRFEELFEDRLYLYFRKLIRNVHEPSQIVRDVLQDKEQISFKSLTDVNVSIFFRATKFSGRFAALCLLFVVITIDSIGSSIWRDSGFGVGLVIIEILDAFGTYHFHHLYEIRMP